MRKKSYINVEIDQLTNSIINAISGDVFETEFHIVTKREIDHKQWLFDWKYEIADKKNEVFKMTIKENSKVIQGLLSVQAREGHVFVNLIENAKFNRGKNKLYLGVGGNMFAFACKRSVELGFEGFVGFDAKTSLMNCYQMTLGAQRALGNRMFIDDIASEKLRLQYFKNE
jgi:hypothetical protein